MRSWAARFASLKVAIRPSLSHCRCAPDNASDANTRRSASLRRKAQTYLCHSNSVLAYGFVSRTSCKLSSTSSHPRCVRKSPHGLEQDEKSREDAEVPGNCRRRGISSAAFGLGAGAANADTYSGACRVGRHSVAMV